MRRTKRTIARVSGIAISVVLFSVAAYAISPTIKRFQNQFVSKTPLVVEPIPTQSASTTVKTTESSTANATAEQTAAVKAQVLGSGSMWWTIHNIPCLGGNGLVNNCILAQAGNTTQLKDTFMMKGFHGLQFSDSVNTTDHIKKCRSGNPKKRNSCDEPDSVVIIDKTFKYCDAGMGSVESLAMMNMSPISYPKMYAGQSISTRRVTDDFYAAIDVASLQNLSNEDLLNKVCNAPTSGDRKLSDLFRTINTYNASTVGTYGINLADALLVTCQLGAPTEKRAEYVRALFTTYDQGKNTLSVQLKLENNNQADNVPARFRSDMISQGLAGLIGPTGQAFIGAWVWSPKVVQHKNVFNINTAAASALLTDWVSVPNKTIMAETEDGTLIDDGTELTESSTLLSGSSLQTEEEKATIKDALFGRVYYMDDSVITDASNIARLTYDPNNFSDSYVCDADKGKCPIIRAKSGCDGDSSSPVDIRLRSITLSMNDTRRYAGTDYQGTPRITNRAGYMLNQAISAPVPGKDTASIDELIVASGKGTVRCAAAATSRVNAQVTKLSEDDMTRLTEYLQGPIQTDAVGVLVTPVKFKYTSFALFDADAGVLAECQHWGGCKGIKVKGNVKKVEGDITRPAFISFPVSIYLEGFNAMNPTSLEFEHRWDDLDLTLAGLNVFPVSDYHIDCDPNKTYGMQGSYWICSNNGLGHLPHCDDNTGGDD